MNRENRVIHEQVIKCRVLNVAREPIENGNGSVEVVIYLLPIGVEVRAMMQPWRINIEKWPADAIADAIVRGEVRIYVRV